jgi:hypothetical protein
MTSILVIAKAPVPGRVKTRLVPPCTDEEAALLAHASLEDTLDTVGSVAQRANADPVLVLDGDPRPWLARGIRVITQNGDGLAERLDAAFADVGGPAVLIGMDTPQITCELLLRALDTLDVSSCDAVFGEADDGGWWLAGFRRHDPRTFAGVPMSTPYTARAQRRRFRELGLRVTELPRLRDVDTFVDANVVAGEAPHTRFAAVLRTISARIANDGGDDLVEATA